MEQRQEFRPSKEFTEALRRIISECNPSTLSIKSLRYVKFHTRLEIQNLLKLDLTDYKAEFKLKVAEIVNELFPSINSHSMNHQVGLSESISTPILKSRNYHDYSASYIISIVKEASTGQGIVRRTAIKYGLTEYVLQDWIHQFAKFRTLSSDGKFDESKIKFNTNPCLWYNDDERKAIVMEYLKIRKLPGSQGKVALKYGISNPTLSRWTKKFNHLLSPNDMLSTSEFKPVPPINSDVENNSRKRKLDGAENYDLNERVKIVKEASDGSNSKRDLAKKYGINAATIYRWIKKYNQSHDEKSSRMNISEAQSTLENQCTSQNISGKGNLILENQFTDQNISKKDNVKWKSIDAEYLLSLTNNGQSKLVPRTPPKLGLPCSQGSDNKIIKNDTSKNDASTFISDALNARLGDVSNNRHSDVQASSLNQKAISGKLLSETLDNESINNTSMKPDDIEISTKTNNSPGYFLFRRDTLNDLGGEKDTLDESKLEEMWNNLGDDEQEVVF